MADNDSASKKTPQEQKALDTVYDRNAAEPLPPPTEKSALYSYNEAVARVDRRGDELMRDLEMNAAERQQYRNTIAEISKVVPDGVLAPIVDLDIDARKATRRVQSDADAEADEVARDQRIQADNARVREELSARYGARDGEQLLERTQRWVRSQPKLAAILKENGIGSRPDVVFALVGHVFSNGLGR